MDGRPESYRPEAYLRLAIFIVNLYINLVLILLTYYTFYVYIGICLQPLNTNIKGPLMCNFFVKQKKSKIS